MLYIVYANDLYSAIIDAPRSIYCNICHPDELQYPNSIYIKQNVDLFEFPDDSKLTCAKWDQNNLVIKLQILMNRDCERFEANCLALNVSKSQFLFFSRIGFQFPSLNIIPSSKAIISRSQNRFVRFLGVLVDENRSFKNHIKLLRLKMSRNLGMIRKLRFIFSGCILKLLYNSIIQP